MTHSVSRSAIAAVAAGFSVLILMNQPGAAESPALAQQIQPFAVIDGVEISQEEFDRAVYEGAARKFYHGQIPANELAKLKSEVADDLVLRYLLIGEADRQQIPADTAFVEGQISAFDRRYGNSEGWETARKELLPNIRRRLGDDSRIAALEKLVREVPEPDEETVRGFYEDNLRLFTEPRRQRVSLILFGVVPGSAKRIWDEAKEEAERAAQRLAKGTDFAALAELHSSDGSAEQGGDMGYLHIGMLSDEAQEAVDKLQPGEISPPVELLQGYAIFMLTERLPPHTRDFRDVRDRALALYIRTKGDSQWEAFKADLKGRAVITLHDPEIAAKTEQKKSSTE